jgi:hypothetical protein
VKRETAEPNRRECQFVEQPFSVLLFEFLIWLRPLISFRQKGTLSRLKRRTLRKFSSAPAKNHYHVYVVLLDPSVAKIRKVQSLNPRRDPIKPCVYVGMTGLTPADRFANHKKGLKSSALVKRFGLRLLPELFQHLNPMPYDAAMQMEKDLTEDLRRAGYTVVGGH